MSTAAASALPSHAAALYDRSERLWGAKAQELLRGGHALLLGATATGSEALKNLVLPGLGSFTIVDDKNVTLRDLGNNFFLEQADLGKNRAASVQPILAELNPMVKGNSINANVDVFATEATGLATYMKSTSVQVVIASGDVRLSTIVALGEMLLGTGVHLLHIKTTGMIGSIRIQSDPSYIVHAMPDIKVEDLRAFNPFPALQAFMERYNPDNKAAIDDHDFAHIPWIAIVFHALAKWRIAKGVTDGGIPANMTQWREVHAVIDQWKYKPPLSDVAKLGDTFIDAKDFARPMLDVSKRNKPELRTILADPRTDVPGPGDAHFWFLCHGLKKFKEANGGLMPVPGAIPDFTATTAMYRELKQIYAQKGAEDAAAIGEFAKAALVAAGLKPEATAKEMVTEFAKNAWDINHVTFPTFADEYVAPGRLQPMPAPGSAAPQCLTNVGTQAYKWYVAHKAAVVYRERFGGEPGDVATAAELEGAAGAAAMDAAVEKLMSIAAEFFADDAAAKDFLAAIRDKEVREMVRFGGGEPVTVASIVGAVGAQEAIKLIQNRRVPLTYIFVYDGIENYFTAIGEKK
jgi:amyloid beta precursor protein binding protein 1